MERRRESRLFINAPGTYRAIGADSSGKTHAMFFSQISASGCRIAEEGCALEPGDRIEIALGPVDEVTATVRWARDNLAGVEFDEPLDAPIVEFFAAHCGKS